MDDELGGEPVPFGELGFTGLAAAQESAFVDQVWTSGAMYRPIDATATQQGGIRGVDDGVHREGRNVRSRGVNLHSVSVAA
jgi:hypothetical protein